MIKGFKNRFNISSQFWPHWINLKERWWALPCNVPRNIPTCYPKQPVSRDANNNFNELIFSQWMCGHCEKLLGMVEDDEMVSKMLYCSKNVHCVTLICNMKRALSLKALTMYMCMEILHWRTDVYQWITYTEHIGLTHCSRWLAMAALAWCTKPSFAKLARWLPSRKYFRSAWNFLSQNLYCWRTRWIL